MNELLKYTTLLFWIPWILKRVLESLYFWQRKEYRLDRVREEIERRPNILISKAVYPSIFLFSTLFFCKDRLAFKPVIFAFYFVLGNYAICSFIKKRLALPKFTRKTIFLLITITCLLLIVLQFAFSSFFLFVLGLEIVTFFFISAVVLCMQIPTFFAKKWIQEKAKRKIKDLAKSVKVIGIAGSYGKSSTKEFLFKILSQKFKVLKTENNINTAIGISKIILNDLDNSYNFFICEMGAYKKGEIKEICEIAKPKIGILTGINEQHLALFGSQKNIVNAKLELLYSLPNKALAFLNWDSELIREHASRIMNQRLRIMECAIDEQIKDLEIRKASISFRIDDVGFELDLTGRQNISNLLMAISCAKGLGMSLEEISNSCRAIKPFRKTMELKKGRGGVDIIDDTYSANPNGVKAGLEHLKLWDGLKIVIMPCLVELGDSAKKAHYEIGERIGKVCDMAVITTRDYFEDIRAGALNAGMKEKDILLLKSTKEIFERIEPFLKEGNVILLESRVPQALIKQLENFKITP